MTRLYAAAVLAAAVTAGALLGAAVGPIDTLNDECRRLEGVSCWEL